ncbi:MAG: hypothetical protein DMD30_12580 [Gemmatimonadetes bacterium]|nr:MAG: hypothetical protein DMD30_12580 [Gemmatimonadota bacterium]
MSACASTGTGSTTSRTSPTRITRAEVTASSATNAYELISRLRPNWLRAQATGSVAGGTVRSQAILVYLNRQRLEDLNALKTIGTTDIDSAEWIDATRVPTVLSDAPQGSIAGAIVIKTR